MQKNSSALCGCDTWYVLISSTSSLFNAKIWCAFGTANSPIKDSFIILNLLIPKKKKNTSTKKNFLAARRRLHQQHFYFLSFYRVWSEKWSYNIRKSISLNFSFAQGSKNHGGSLWYTYSTPPSSPVKYLAKYQSLGPENCRVFAKEEERGHTCHCCRHLLPQSILSLFKKDIPTHLRSLGSSVPIRLNITFTH